MGSLTGAVVAGVLVGVVVSLTSLVSPEAGRVSIFILMAVVLLVRPQGLFGRTGVGLKVSHERTQHAAGKERVAQ